MSKDIEITSITKMKQIEYGWEYRAIFRYKGRMAFLNVSVLDEVVDNVNLQEYISGLCLMSAESLSEEEPNA